MKRVVVGDTIQWESQGSYFFDKPREVQNVVHSETRDSTYVLVEDGPTGIPVDEIHVVDRCKEHYGDGVWRCPECQTGWDSEVMHKHQIPLPANCPHCHDKLVFEEAD